MLASTQSDAGTPENKLDVMSSMVWESLLHATVQMHSRAKL